MKKLALILAMVLTMLATACSNNGGEPAPTNSPVVENSGDKEDNKQPEEPTEITVMSHFFGATPPKDDNEVELKIEEATNTKLKIEWNASSNYLDKFNVKMASGDLPDLVLMPNSHPYRNPVFVDSAKNGVFWDVAPYIADYPNLTDKISEEAWESTKINGGNYLIPRPRSYEAGFFWIIRGDWLKNVGLEEPTTLEDIYAIAKAFTENDPDQNGKDDTFGFAGETVETLLFSTTGINGEWGLKDGKVVFSAFEPGGREAIEIMVNAYNEGLVNPDFASMQATQIAEQITGGKAGIWYDTTAVLPNTHDLLVKNNPDLKLTDYVAVKNINGVNPQSVSFNGGLAIPKSVSEEKMKKILAMLNRWMDDDVFAYQTQGIEGIHHTIDASGKKIVNTEALQKDGLDAYVQIVNVADYYGNAVNKNYPEDVQEHFKKIADERAKTSVPVFNTGIISDTAQSFLPEIREEIKNLRTKIVLGGAKISDWDAFVEKTMNDPRMQQSIKEMNEKYASLQQ